MIIFETPVFTKQIQKLLSEDSYAEFQEQIRFDPECGDLIKHSGGLRKVRWGAEGRGKRGGIRVIYYWFTSTDSAYMLLAYAKNEQSDLTADQLKILKYLIEEELSDGR